MGIRGIRRYAGRSRGFAFILFKDTGGLKAASAQEAHTIKGKKVTCKKAVAKQGKVYVGKLPEEGVTVEHVQAHFAQFGPVVEVERQIDKNKSKPKNFCFVTFKREETAKAMMKEGTAIINGHEVDVKKVIRMAQLIYPVILKDGSQGGFGGHGGYGGGYGGYGGAPLGAGGKMRGPPMGARGAGRGRGRPY